MTSVNIYGEPLSVAEIKQLRKDNSFEESAAFKVFMYTPIPVLDVIAGATALAVQEAFFSNDIDLQSYPGETDRTWWSESPITQMYVSKVRDQGRSLIGIEIEALRKHLALEAQAKSIASAVIDHVSDKCKEAVTQPLLAATSEVESWIKSWAPDNAEKSPSPEVNGVDTKWWRV